ncbi:MAG: nuclear transport factor 2 family protein [Acidobacteria bacterium]|nr:nuclear transport factor 2 family protein [Acidobacteriota bacterium]MCA1635105.1 nuclear transport factor 2 family protein [Acidobacteriota bacterium]
MKVATHFFSRVATALLGLALTVVAAAAQEKPKQGDDTRKTGGAAEAWKQALPDAEEIAPPGGGVKRGAGGAEEDTPAATELRLRDLERKWMDATKAGDAVSLKRFLAADFTLAGMSGTESLIDKKQYVAETLRDLKLESYSLDELRVRVYLGTAVVSGRYRQRATMANEDWSGDFLFTDVWIRGAGGWKAVSRHVTRLPAVAVKGE